MSTALWSIYQKRGRWYLDARKIGGGQRALVPEEETRATTDRKTALRLAQDVASKLVAEKTAAERMGYNRSLGLHQFGSKYLAQRAKAGELSEDWQAVAEQYLNNAVHFFEDVQPAEAMTREDRRRMTRPRNLASITAADVAEFQTWLAAQPNGRGGTYSAQTVRHHCTVLSGIFQRAIRLGLGQVATNPVRAAGLPAVPATETPLLEAETVALLLEAARLVQEEAVESSDPRLTARRMVHVALTLLAYTGARMDECERIDWADLRWMADGSCEVRIYGASKGTKAGQRRKPRFVPLSSHAVPVLLEWRRRSARLAGPVLAAPESGSVPGFAKAFAAVERRSGLPRGVLGSRTLRVAYATHRASCEGVTWNDVRDELGHADLGMQGEVYGRGRLNREPMGAEMDYRFARWARLLPDAGAQLAASSRTPGRADQARPERTTVIRAFLDAVEGWGVKRAMEETGVDKAAIQRLRAGTATNVQDRTLSLMKAYLSRRAQSGEHAA